MSERLCNARYKACWFTIGLLLVPNALRSVPERVWALLLMVALVDGLSHLALHRLTR